MQRLRQNNHLYGKHNDQSKQAIRFYSLFIWVIPLFFCVMIFRFSAQTGEESTGVSSPLTQEIVATYSEVMHQSWNQEEIMENAEALEVYVRKAGHMAEYAMLTVSVVLATWISFGASKRNFIFAELFCVCYAASDEIHQLFVPGRCGKFSDVLIDSAGSLVALLCMICIIHRLQKCKKLSGQEMK